MEASENSQKLFKQFCCASCDYTTLRKSDYTKHLATGKHENNTNASEMLDNTSKKSSKLAIKFKCNCGKTYQHDSSYYRHKKKCTTPIYQETNENKMFELTQETIMQILKQNSEFQHLLLEQNKTIIELSKNNSITNNTNNTNSHNKTFNLQFFLNETCKNAMNITDFVDSLQLQLSDLEKVGEIGYVEGISNIIIKNLNALDVTLRPVHCTDKKRETMYIKDEDKWEKEDENKAKMHKMVKKVSNKNIQLISEFKELHPEWKKCSSKYADQFNTIVIESMGGAGDNDFEKEEKIIKKVAKEVLIHPLRKVDLIKI
jgi:hypothetical protein